MGFKLGKGKRPAMYGGNIKSKMRFGQEAGESNISVPGTPIIRKQLEEGVLGEANMDGSIYISDKIKPGSFEERQVVNHEMKHATDMKIGRLAYTDDYVLYNGDMFLRKNVDGVDSILVDGKWKPAGDHDFPWEKEANISNGHEHI